MPGVNILLAEDDALLGEGVRNALLREGYAVEWVRDGKSALHQCLTGPCHLLILDLGLPVLDGMQVLRTLREQANKCPVLILTARSAIESRIAGLDAGAEDYLTKPFDSRELLARVRVLLRRNEVSNLITYRDLVLNTDEHVAQWRGEPVVLSRREFSLLRVLVEKPGRIFTRDELERHMYEWGEEVSSNTIEVHIHNLRRKIAQDLIHTVRGIGYQVEKV